MKGSLIPELIMTRKFAATVHLRSERASRFQQPRFPIKGVPPSREMTWGDMGMTKSQFHVEVSMDGMTSREKFIRNTQRLVRWCHVFFFSCKQLHQATGLRETIPEIITKNRGLFIGFPALPFPKVMSLYTSKLPICYGSRAVTSKFFDSEPKHCDNPTAPQTDIRPWPETHGGFHNSPVPYLSSGPPSAGVSLSLGVDLQGPWWGFHGGRPIAR